MKQPDGIEFRTEQARRNLSREETLGYIDQQLQSRLALANMVNSLAIPWGLMDVLVPAGNGTGYVPLEYYSSYRAQLKKANGVFDGEEFDLIADPVACHPLLEAWVGQYWGIRDMERTAPIISFSSHGYNDLQSLDPITLDSSIPVFHILSNLTAEQVCLGPFLKTNPAECAKAVFANEVSINGKIRATEQLGNGTVVFGYCNFDGCGLGFPFERAEWTAGEIVKALNVIGF